MTISSRIPGALVLAHLSLTACNFAIANDTQEAGHVTLERLVAGEGEPDAWVTGGRDWRQTYYSPLRDINETNVKDLGFAWSYDVDFSDTLEATPIVIDGVMYTSGNHGHVYALDATTGKPLWKFEPATQTLGFLQVNRGVAFWQGKVYVCTTDGWLYALNAANGSVVWKVDTILDRTRQYSSTGATYIAGNRVIIGNAGADYDARGYITAYDTANGKQAWRFFTVPGDPKKGFEHPELKKAARTWPSNSAWDVGLGGTAWDGMAYDPQLNLLYVGTGNGGPWDRSIRSPGGGDNLFLASILALNPDNGRLVCYYQTTPGESWDYTATQKMILADLDIKGRKRRTMLQAPKNGFFYVLDRATGELLSAQPYTKVNWATGVDLKTGRPILTGSADYTRDTRVVLPGPHGGHQWQPMSYNEVTGLVYLPAQEIPAVFTSRPDRFTYHKSQLNEGAIYAVVAPDGRVPDGVLPEGVKVTQTLSRPKMFLRAWNPVEQRLAWEVDITGSADGTSFVRRPGGVMSTASALVFQGHIDGHFRVFDGRTGAQLRDIYVGTSILAAPMTYRIGGEQYISVMAGVGAHPGYEDFKYGNKGRIITFKLGGGDVPLRPLSQPEATASEPVAPPDTGTVEQVANGRDLFEARCALCHTTGRGPDLTRISAATHAEFLNILLKGTRSERGMPSFAGLMSQTDAQDIHAFIIHATALRNGSAQPKVPQTPQHP